MPRPFTRPFPHRDRPGVRRRPRLGPRAAAAAVALCCGVPGAFAAAALPPVFGTTLLGTQTFASGLSVRGEPVSFAGFGGGTLGDLDGDGTAERYALVLEPGRACSTFVFVPSRRGTIVDLDPADLSGFAIVRGIGAGTAADGSRRDCNGAATSVFVRSVGDIDGNGFNAFTLPELPAAFLIDAGVTPGTVIDAVAPAGPFVTRIAPGTTLSGIGDVTGDGIDDFVLAERARGRMPLTLPCRFVAGERRGFDVLDARDASTLAVFGTEPAMEPRESLCRRARPAGDLDGDGTGDLLMSADRFLAQGTWVLHGSASLRIDGDPRTGAYRPFETCPDADGCAVFPAGDVDADGRDDVTVRVRRGDGPGTHLLHGGPAGLPRAVRLADLPAGRVTRLPGANAFPVGDLNADGATDLALGAGYGGDYDPTVLRYGTPGYRERVVLRESIDGSTGAVWLETARPGLVFGRGDLDGDGVDDLAWGTTGIRGRPAARTGFEARGVALAVGPASVDAVWNAPARADEVAGYRIGIEGGTTLETADARARVPLDPGAADGAALVIESLDGAGAALASVRRALVTPRFRGEPLLPDTEVAADGTRVPAAGYRLDGAVYGPRLGELFWQPTKRFVLLWRDGRVVDRTEASSYMVRADADGGGDFFVTKDYPGLFPGETTGLLGTSGVLRRSDVASLPLAGDGPPAAAPANAPRDPGARPDAAPPAPSGLSAAVYSATAAELFWTRPDPQLGVTSHRVSRDGVPVATVDGTSAFFADLVPGRNHRFELVALDGEGVASAPVMITVRTGEAP